MEVDIWSEILSQLGEIHQDDTDSAFDDSQQNTIANVFDFDMSVLFGTEPNSIPSLDGPQPLDDNISHLNLLNFSSLLGESVERQPQ